MAAKTWLVDLGYGGVARVTVGGDNNPGVEIFPGRDAALEGSRPIHLSLWAAANLATAILEADLEREARRVAQSPGGSK